MNGWVLMLVVLSGMGVGAAAEPIPPDVQRKLARLDLARSIRAFAAGTLAHGDCLVGTGAISQRQAREAMVHGLKELGIDPVVLTNPQVLKATELLQPQLDDSCALSAIDDATARQLVADEL